MHSRNGLFCVLAALSLGGCTAMQKSQAMDTERTLAAAGFNMQLADTPAKLSQISALPQRKLTMVPGPSGAIRYVYADTEFCKCAWAGDAAAYGRYQKLAISQQIADEEEDAAMDWGVWGPWY